MSTDRSKIGAVPLKATTHVTAPRKVHWGDVLAPYLFIAPFILSFVLLFLGPALYSLVLSFFRYKGYGRATFVGLTNYSTILKYHVFWTELQNTVFYWLAHVFPLMICAFLLALLVRSNLIGWRSVAKPIIFLPNIIATVAAALVFQSLFGTEYGVINQMLGLRIPWLQDATLTKLVVVTLAIWSGTGWWFVVFLAGLTSINPELEEAAIVDGASTWQRLRYIVMPLMRGTFLFAFVIDAIGSFRLFTEVNVLAGGGGAMARPDVAPVLNMLVSNMNSANFGSAAAVGWIIFVLVVLVALVQFRLLRDTREEA
jgi:ABC-type sugar transport system permease subunit